MASGASAQTVFLARHAEKVSDSQDTALSEAGKQRATCLAEVLKDSGIKAIYVSQTVRARDTATPLAKLLGISVTELPPKDYDALVARIRANPNQNALVIGHSNTIPDIIRRLGAAEAPRIADHEYDWLFVVDGEPDRMRLAKLRVCGLNPSGKQPAMQKH